MASCKENSAPIVEPNTAQGYRIEFTQVENYKTVQKQLAFGEGIMLTGYIPLVI